MKFYALLQGDEDGNPFKPLIAVEELLDNPEEFASVLHFMDEEEYSLAPSNPAYWPDGEAVLLKCEVVVPRPAGKYVLPEE